MMDPQRQVDLATWLLVYGPLGLFAGAGLWLYRRVHEDLRKDLADAIKRGDELLQLEKDRSAAELAKEQARTIRAEDSLKELNEQLREQVVPVLTQVSGTMSQSVLVLHDVTAILRERR